MKPFTERNDENFRGEDLLMHYHHKHAWQPFTQMKLSPDPEVVEKASGSKLYLQDGRTVIDAIGSWWVSVHGHNHARLNRAIKDQVQRLEHVMYSGFTHEPALQLSARLSQCVGHAMPRVFFSDNGSTAVEIALKMAYQYFTNAGRSEKTEFVALAGGYHGDTIGTMSVGGRSVFHKMYEKLLFSVHYAERPLCPFGGHESVEQSRIHIEPAIASLRSMFREHGEKICAFILEPMIQGAGGMNVYPASYLQEARKICDEYGAFLIADEVFTGCNRTGPFLACEHAGIVPDIVALSKGLSAGYLPFAATLATEKIFQGFYSDDRKHTLFHGHSMTANPLGCAVSLASLDLLAEEGEKSVHALEEAHRNRLGQLQDGPLASKIREIRYLGSVAVVELDLNQDYTGTFGWNFWRKCIERGVLLRPIGPVIYLTPAYNIGFADLDRVYDVLEKTALELL